MKKLCVSIAVLITLIACRSPSGLYKADKPDAAIEKALMNIRKGRAKSKDIIALEQAFNKINQEDYAQVQTLLEESSPSRWPRIYTISKRIDDRQNVVKPYLPIEIPNEHRPVELVLYPIKPLLGKSKTNAAEYYYATADDLLNQGRQGDRMAARNAFYELEKVERYVSPYKDVVYRLQEAAELGTTHILLSVDNRTMHLLPMNYKQDFLGQIAREAESQWVALYTDPSFLNGYDYEANIQLMNLFVGPEDRLQNTFWEEREIEDGTEYVLDQNGNVLSDSLGNDIKVPHYTTIRAQVFELIQQKGATLNGVLNLVNTYNKRIEASDMFESEVHFSNRVMTYEGDRDALSDEVKCEIGGQPVPFPTDAEMLYDATQGVIDQLEKLLCRYVIDL